MSKNPTASARARDRARHEHEILSAAERVFARKGYEGATMASIAKEAGFAIGTLYNLFAAKDAILERLLTGHLDALGDEIAAARAKAPSPRGALEAMTRVRARYLARHRDFFRLYTAEVPGTWKPVGGRAGPAVTRALGRALAEHVSAFEQLPSSCGLDAATRALVFFAATRCYLTERVLQADRPPRSAELGAVVASLLDGLAAG